MLDYFIKLSNAVLPIVMTCLGFYIMFFPDRWTDHDLIRLSALVVLFVFSDVMLLRNNQNV